MKNSPISPALVAAVRTYASALFGSRRQVRNLRRAFPGVVDPEAYDALEQCLAGAQTVAEERCPARAAPAPATHGPASVARFNALLSAWRANPQSRGGGGFGPADVPLLFGSVWTVRTHASMAGADWGITTCLPMVVLGETPGADTAVLQIFPLSLWPEFAADHDLVVTGAPLPDPMMVEVWNEQPLLREQLLKCVGALAPQDLRRLAALACEARTGRGGDGLGQVPPADRGAALAGDDDPRRLFQQIELLRTLPLRVPALDWLAGQSRTIPRATPDADWSFPPWQAAPASAALARAAKEAGPAEANARRDRTFEVVGRPLSLRVELHTGRRRCGVWVFDAAGEPSAELDGAVLVSRSGSRSPPVAGGQTVADAALLADGFQLIAADGTRLTLRARPA